MVDSATRREAYKLLNAAVFPAKADFFATKFKYIAQCGAADEGWRVFDDVIEYARLGLPNDSYRVTGARLYSFGVVIFSGLNLLGVEFFFFKKTYA